MTVDVTGEGFAESWPPEQVEALYTEAREARRTAGEIVQEARRLRAHRHRTLRSNHRLIVDARLAQERPEIGL
jgi:hypothetical protein